MDPSLLLLLVFAGVLAGFLAGLMGIGGGIVTVPILYYVLGVLGTPENMQMHMAVATSLAVIIPTSVFSAKVHHAKGAIDLSLIKNWAPYIIVGVAIGAFLSTGLDTKGLKLFFAIMAFIMGVRLVLKRGEETQAGIKNHKGVKSRFLASGVGLFSSLMGIGGATFSVPIMRHYNYPIHKAIGTASLIGLIISVPATLSYIYSSFDAASLPKYSIGYVNLFVFIIVAPLSAFIAPIGAKVAHRLKPNSLSLFFGLFLMITGFKMSGFIF